MVDCSCGKDNLYFKAIYVRMDRNWFEKFISKKLYLQIYIERVEIKWTDEHQLTVWNYPCQFLCVTVNWWFQLWV